MKNFTNNFKQFTSRLSARWLIMALMLLVGTSSAWGETFLSGTFNGWNASDNNYKFISGTLNVSMSPGTYEFKVVEDGKWYSMNNTNITGTVSSGITMYENNNNNKITITYTGVYTFTWDGTNNKLKVTYPPLCSSCCTDYYIAGISNWNANADKMSCDNNVWSKKFTDKDAGSYEFKVTNGSWNTDSDKDNEWSAFDNSKGNITCSGGNGSNIKFTTTSKGDITISFDGSKAWVTWEANCTKPNPPSIASSHSSICSGDDTEVTITVTGDADTYVLYVVNNGYTKQSNEAVNNTFTVSPTKTTTYVVKAFNGACASDNYSNEEEVTVSEKPYITLNPTSTAICKGDQLDLSKFATSTVNLTWWNGDTQITEPVSPEQNTTYTVKAVNGACTVSKDLNVTVNALPDAPTNLGSATICNGDKVTLPEVTGSWYTEATTTTPLASISIEVNPAETTSYFATSKSNNCESSSRTEYVVKVKSLASANNYELTKTTAVYTGTAVTLQTSDVNVTNNAGTVSSIYFKQNGNTVNPINVGEYDVYVTTVATDDICAGDIKIGTFTITQATQAELFISNEQVKYCGLPSEAIILTSTGGSTDETVIYESGDNTVATIDGSELSVLKEGTVTITATRPGGDNYNNITATKQFTFYKAPEKPTASQVVNIQQCKNGFTNGKIVINNVEPGNELDKYEYTINHAATGNAKDGFVISNKGDYVVTVTRTVDGCTMQTNSDPITVETDDNTPTITDVTISGDAEVCINTGTTLTASVTAEN